MRSRRINILAVNTLGDVCDDVDVVTAAPYYHLFKFTHCSSTCLASLIGMCYTLQGEIEEAKQLPSLETLYEAEYPSKPEGHNWPRSFEQYKNQVGGLQDDMEIIYETVEELEDYIKELQKDIKDLERRKRDKK